jgi:hypothetical protein
LIVAWYALNGQPIPKDLRDRCALFVFPPGSATEEKMPKFYTVKETMEILRLSRPTVSLKIRSGKIPVVRLSSESKHGRVLIPAEFIDDLVEKSMRAVQQGVN